MIKTARRGSQRPPRRPAVSGNDRPGRPAGTGLRVGLLAKLARVKRAAELSVSRAVQSRLWRSLRALGRTIAKPMVRLAAMIRTGRIPPGRIGPEVDNQARSA